MTMFLIVMKVVLKWLHRLCDTAILRRTAKET